MFLQIYLHLSKVRATFRSSICFPLTWPYVGIINSVLATVPVLTYSSGRGANLCVSCLYSHACLHTQFHLGLFWRPVKIQASGTNNVCEKECPCMFNYNRTLFLSLCLVGSPLRGGASLQPCIIVAFLKYDKKKRY